ncbi:MAG: pyridoxamine 5'-phosphate oxidase family protein [Nocardioides sp.]|nr:pyridoxamine 5'-phosphate oxidase family protein [Nocardioides sp.]
MDSTRGGGRLAELTPYDCWALIAEVQVGRVAWCRPEGPGVVPVNLAVLHGAVWFRTTNDSALVKECRGQRVAVEVDEVDLQTRSGWSVVVLGVAEVIDPDDAPQSLHLMEAWPAGDRSAYVRVESLEVSGRRLLAPPTG